VKTLGYSVYILQLEESEFSVQNVLYKSRTILAVNCYYEYFCKEK